MGASVSVAQGAPLDAGTYKADEVAVALLRIAAHPHRFA